MSIKNAFLTCVTLAGTVSAGIGENFERGGIWLGGDAWATVRDIGKESSQTSFLVKLQQNFYVVDNLSLGLSESYYRWGSSEDVVSLLGSVGYTFLKNPEASQGVAHTVNLGLGGSIWSNYESLNSFNVKPSYTFEYFVSDRIAPYFTAGPAIEIFKDKTKTDLNMGLGLAIHFPTKMRVIIPME